MFNLYTLLGNLLLTIVIVFMSLIFIVLLSQIHNTSALTRQQSTYQEGRDKDIIPASITIHGLINNLKYLFRCLSIFNPFFLINPLQWLIMCNHLGLLPAETETKIHRRRRTPINILLILGCIIDRTTIIKREATSINTPIRLSVCKYELYRYVSP